MPSMPPKPCSVCSVLVRDGTSRCTQHKVAAWQKPHATETKRITGRKLQRMREQLFYEEPLCRHCAAKGITKLATQRDHILSLGEGGTEEPENIQPLCDDCHDIKSRSESVRARRGGGQKFHGH